MIITKKGNRIEFTLDNQERHRMAKRLDRVMGRISIMVNNKMSAFENRLKALENRNKT